MIRQKHTGLMWCEKYVEQRINSAMGVGIGDGFSNTAKAAEVCTSGAIRAAADFTSNGKSDWHLPSKDELNALYLYLPKQDDWYSDVGITQNWGTRSHWSSSSVNQEGAAWVQHEYGEQKIESSTYTAEARAIRAF